MSLHNCSEFAKFNAEIENFKWWNLLFRERLKAKWEVSFNLL